MTRGFQRGRGGEVRCRLSDGERVAFDHIVGQVGTLLAGGLGDRTDPPETDRDELAELVGLSSEPAERPSDPALLRLFPDAYQDAADSADFRRYTQDALWREKVERLAAVQATLADSGGQLTLGAEQAEAWLRALTDVRLVLADRLGLETDADVDRLEVLAVDDPRRQLAEAYDWLTFLQETLVRAVAGW